MNQWFRSAFGVIFSRLGSFPTAWRSFLKQFSVLGGTLGAVWAHFWVQKTVGGTTGAPSGAKEAPPPKSPHPFGLLVGPFFYISLCFLSKKIGSEMWYIFSSIFGSPWALRGMGSYAIRTRRRSPNTILRFHIFRKNSFQKASFWLRFGYHFHQKLRFWVDKNGFEKWFKKRYPPRCKWGTIPGSGASRTVRLACAFSEQETTIWARSNNSCSFLSPFLNPVSGIGHFLCFFFEICCVFIGHFWYLFRNLFSFACKLR